MKSVNATLGRRKSPGAVMRGVRGIRTAIDQGRAFGRPMDSLVLAAVCETCGTEFLWTKGGQREGVKSQTTGRFCSHPCLVKWLHKHRQILPDIETIKRLYWDEGMSLWEIARKFGARTHKAVEHAMRKGGIRRRSPKNSGKRVCIIEGCREAAFKIPHKTNGSNYGRRCEKHWFEHRAKLARDYRRRTHNSPALKIVEFMEQGEATSKDIAIALNESYLRIWIAMGHLKRFGVVESAGMVNNLRQQANIWKLTPEWKSRMPEYLTN